MLQPKKTKTQTKRKERTHWYRDAAEGGNADAQFKLGTMYDNGVTEDYIEAAKWYRKAAEQGVVAAQNNLGVMYLHGHGVGQDYVQAFAWFYFAASQGSAVARKNCKKITEKLLPAQITEAQALAKELSSNYDQR